MVKRLRLQKGVHMMCTPFRKGLDKEMGMSGMDAMHPSGKYDKQLTLIFRLWSPESSGSVLCIR